MQIGVDIDGILADSVPYIYEFLSRKFPEATVADVLALHSSAPQAYADYFDQFEDVIYQHVPVMRGARRALERLSPLGRIHIISARTPRVRPATEAWLQHNRLRHDSLHMLCGGDKGAVCRELGIDVFVEDQVHNARAISSAGVPVIMLEAPYNRTFLAPGVVHAGSWPEIVGRIGELLDGRPGVAAGGAS